MCEALALQSGRPVCYFATLPPILANAKRIQLHAERRPKHWLVVMASGYAALDVDRLGRGMNSNSLLLFDGVLAYMMMVHRHARQNNFEVGDYLRSAVSMWSMFFESLENWIVVDVNVANGLEDVTLEVGSAAESVQRALKRRGLTLLVERTASAMA